MNIEKTVKNLKNYISFSKKECNFPTIYDWNWNMDLANNIETLLTAYEKEKEKNKNAIDFINERKKTVNKDMAEGTRLQVGTFMWQVDELLEILKEE